jgi:hypothetical protein
MATGRKTQLTRQVGEHLVAAKLGRLGYVAAPFAGNVPLFDLLAADVRGFSVPIQVKAMNGISWQLKADTFLDIELVDGVQHVRGRKPLVNPELICVFVLLRADENDEFYIFRMRELQDVVVSRYPGGRRPKNPESMHCSIYPEHLSTHKEMWSVIEQSFPSAP